MIGFVITLLLSATFLTAIAVLVPSLRQAWKAYGELSRALAFCNDDRVATVRITEPAKRAPQARRHVRGAGRPIQPARTGALRAVA